MLCYFYSFSYYSHLIKNLKGKKNRCHTCNRKSENIYPKSLLNICLVELVFLFYNYVYARQLRYIFLKLILTFDKKKWNAPGI